MLRSRKDAIRDTDLDGIIDAVDGTSEDARGRDVMNSVVLAKTASGSTYVLSIGDDGVQWRRLPRDGVPGTAWRASGWATTVPRIVPGERLLIGDLRSTPVTRVEVLPA